MAHALCAGESAVLAAHSPRAALASPCSAHRSAPARLAIPECSRLSKHNGSAMLRAQPAPLHLAAPTAHRRGRPGACRALFGLGIPELLVIGGVAVVLFGPKQLPEIGKSLGKTVKGFQEAAKEFSTELKQAAQGEPEEETKPTGAVEAPKAQQTEKEKSETKQ